MTDVDPSESPTVTPAQRMRYRKTRWIVFLLGVYLGLAYLLIPMIWRRAERHHPAIAGLPQIATTHDNIPGDPMNLALIGSEGAVSRDMLAAGWHPADPLTLESCLRIADDTVLRRPYVDAPVSNLFVWGRKQDLAFEQPVGNDPRRRHHVRFWRSTEVDDNGLPLWIGAATFDEKVGFSHTTGQITHHIGSDVDTERDKILADLQAHSKVIDINWLDPFHKQLSGRNGGGDPWHTDGRLPAITLSL